MLDEENEYILDITYTNIKKKIKIHVFVICNILYL